MAESNNQEETSPLPRWETESIYEYFNAIGHVHDKTELENKILLFQEMAEDEETRTEDPRGWLKDCIQLYNEALDLYENLGSYAYMCYSTNTEDTAAVSEINFLEYAVMPLRRAEPVFRNALKEIEEALPSLMEQEPELAQYQFFFQEQLELQEKQMTPEEEEVAADLARSGGDAWERLQESVSSSLQVTWDSETGEKKTVTQLRSLARDPNRKVRKKAWRKELGAWKSMGIPLASALNGVKGTAITLNQRRGWERILDRSIHQSRITQTILDSLIHAIEESLPGFQEYLQKKAGLLGQDKLSFYDLYAPVADRQKNWTFQEARNFIIEQFAGFSHELADFTCRVFNEGWIDAEPHTGKVGGAYCISLPGNKESRILCNFDGTFSSVTTLAHELGHAYHNHILRDAPAIHRQFPMTLAETASTFAETIIINAAMQKTDNPEEKKALLEDYLQDSTHVIVDILSRFLFERAMLWYRRERELSEKELCQLMLQAQKAAYGPALDERELHPYMWAVKGHYYSTELAFYNYPYAFGQLFALSLYSRFEEDGKAFADTYKEILLRTGLQSAASLGQEIGTDLEDPDFWRSGIASILSKVEIYKAL